MGLWTWFFFFLKTVNIHGEVCFKNKKKTTLYPKCWTATNWKDRTRLRNVHGNERWSFKWQGYDKPLLPFSYRYFPQMGNAWCLTADQSGCAVSEQDPTAAVGDSFQKLLLEEQWLLPKGKVSLCHVRQYVPSLKDVKHSKSLRGIYQATETSPSSGNRNTEWVVENVFQKCKRGVLNSFIFMTVSLWGC